MPLDLPHGAFSLDDRYQLDRGRIYLSATQALVRLPLERRRLDLAAGHDTAGYVSGYRGSPLGGLDLELWNQTALLSDHKVTFQPGVNEELAATALWGTQQVGLYDGARQDGVFGFWYGKGPGVDRSGDAFKHANLAGTSPLGGVVVLAGDDHGAKSSTSAHQSDQALIAAMIPTLYPADVQDVLDFGQVAIELGRYSGCWTALKLVTEVAESSGTADVGPNRHMLSRNLARPDADLHIRLGDDKLAAEARLLEVKLPAAQAFARAHGLDRIAVPADTPRLGIVSAGKAYHDVMQALSDLGLDRSLAGRLGLTVYKVAMTWPLEPEGITEFARPLCEVLVVEEKRSVVEPQVKQVLFDNLRASAPQVFGKFDAAGKRQLPEGGELSVAQLAHVLADWLDPHLEPADRTRVRSRLRPTTRGKVGLATQARTEFFCAGCPHNRSTRLPGDSIALAGIGCHTMASRIAGRNTMAPAQMGGEGGHWIGQAPFTDRAHVFQNIGDGTYFHSGVLGIRAAIAAGVTITFKLLYNGAVAMTGGQPVEGDLSIGAITQELDAEGVTRIVIVSDDPDRHGIGAGFARGVTVRPRTELDAVQRDLRETSGVSVLIYDQACAAEKRRRRRRGSEPAPTERVFINEQVCEGCGDCGIASSCVAVRPVETPFGTKRQVDQSACNTDMSCLEGFCPSFVTVEGAAPVDRCLQEPAPNLLAELQDPSGGERALPYGLLLTGIGGTGVVTVSAILGTAAHLEGRAVRVLDVTGVAQKNGAVTCHLQWSDPGETLHAARLGPGRVSLVLACDSVVAGSEEVRCLIDPEETHVVANSDIQATAASTFDPDGIELDRQTIERVSDSASCVAWLPANRLAQALCGDTIYGNILQLGFAVQRGLVSISRQSVEQAIELNGVAVAHNKAAFAWGRLAAADLGAVTKTAGLDQRADEEAVTLDDLIDSRCDLLIAYQGDRLAERFLERVQRIRAAESAISEGHALTEVVARNYAKLLAYKDEYEVARLYSDGAFKRAIADRFGDAGRVRIWLAPPLLAARDPETGRLVKRAYGPWVLTAMTVLSRLRPLRGTRFDPFGRTAERRRERRLIVDYEEIVDRLAGALEPHNLEAAIALAGLPDRVRGYGHIKEASMDRYEDEVAKLLKAFAAASSSGGNAAPKQGVVSDIRPAPVTPTTSSTGSAYQ